MTAENAKAQVKWGVLLAKGGKREEAMVFFNKAIENDQEYAAAYFNLANALVMNSDKVIQTADRERAVELYRKTIQLHPNSLEARTNLAAQLMALNQIEAAVDECFNVLALDPSYSEAHYNLGVALRRNGQHQRAVELCWDCIVRDGGTRRDFQLNIPNIDSKSQEITFVSVKWGMKYNAEYVNKLYRGIQRFMDQKFTFLCLTEDANGLDETIQVHPLPKSAWTGWWNKIQLFSPDLPITQGRIVYIDLDSIVVSSLAKIVSYVGSFGILGTESMRNEQRKHGYNSSVMIWPARTHFHIYSTFCELQSIVSRYLYKFDHWIEMMVPGADKLQDVLGPHVICEYKQCCEEDLLSKTSVVTFPLKPKPHDYPAEWIGKFWT